NRESCILYYERENSYACFGLSLVPRDEDLNTLLYNNRVVQNGKFYYLTHSSFKCENGDLSCYDRIAYVMNVDVDSIIPKEGMTTTIDIEKGCESESGAFHYTSSNYVCLHKYQDEKDVPENSVCYLDEKRNIYCVNGKYTEKESCLRDNEKFDYNSCRISVENTVMSKNFYPYSGINSISSISYTPIPYPEDGPAISYYIYIEGDGESTDKPSLLKIVNERMNDIYEIIYNHKDKYRYFSNDAIDRELDTTYPEGKKFLFVDELSQDSTFSDFIPMNSSLIKLGNYLSGEENGCSTSSGCHTIYAYLTKDMVVEVKKLSNIAKIDESNAYSYVSVKNDRAPKTTPYPKSINDPIPPSKALPVITSTKIVPLTTKAVPLTTKTVPLTSKTVPLTTKAVPLTTTSTANISVTTTSTKTVPLTTKTVPPTTDSTKEITTTDTRIFPKTLHPKVVPIITTTTKVLPITNCVPVTVTEKEQITVTEKEKITVTEKEIVTVTVGGESTNQATSQFTNCVPKWGQCGGIGYSGPTCCQTGSTCREYGAYFSQCNGKTISK
ncbi:carbohydrate-binding module family 1 protein, partial [Piromyces sp. E2]